MPTNNDTPEAGHGSRALAGILAALFFSGCGFILIEAFHRKSFGWETVSLLGVCILTTFDFAYIAFTGRSWGRKAGHTPNKE